MKILVASINNEVDFRAHVYSISYHEQEKSFSIPRPMGDDWLQRIYHTPTPPPILVRKEDEILIVIFESTESANHFAEWLLSAEAEAHAGYSTMRG